MVYDASRRYPISPGFSFSQLSVEESHAQTNPQTPEECAALFGLLEPCASLWSQRRDSRQSYCICMFVVAPMWESLLRCMLLWCRAEDSVSVTPNWQLLVPAITFAYQQSPRPQTLPAGLHHGSRQRHGQGNSPECQPTPNFLFLCCQSPSMVYSFFAKPATEE